MGYVSRQLHSGRGTGETRPTFHLWRPPQLQNGSCSKPPHDLRFEPERIVYFWICSPRRTSLLTTIDNRQSSKDSLSPPAALGRSFFNRLSLGMIRQRRFGEPFAATGTVRQLFGAVERPILRHRRKPIPAVG